MWVARVAVAVSVSVSVAVCACSSTAPRTEPHTEPRPPPPPSAPSHADTDALWQLAPATTRTAIVVSAHGVSQLEHAYAQLRRLASGPDTKELGSGLDEIARDFLGSGHTLDEAGMTADGGAAEFDLHGDSYDTIYVLPVFDPARFQAATSHRRENVCRRIAARYACARKAASLDLLGKSSELHDRALAQADRGDLEVFSTDREHHDTWIAFRADAGQLVARGVTRDVPDGIPPLAGVVAPPAELAGATGFVRFDLSPLRESLRDDELVPGVPASRIIHALRGPVTATATAGPADARVHLPLAEPAAIEALLARCGELAQAIPGAIADATPHRCHVTIAGTQLDATAVVDGGELRIELGHPATTGAAPAGWLARELAEQPWTFAAWGHGSVLAPAVVPLSLVVGPNERELAALFARVASVVDELGVGVRVDRDGATHFLVAVRTAWSNPETVVADRLAIAPAAVIAGDAPGRAREIAATTPKAPFAADFAAGQSGLVVPAALALGGFAAILDVRDRPARRPEALLQLNKLTKTSKTLYITNATYLAGSAGPTPAQPCCGQPDNKCHSAPTDWTNDPVWHGLDFEIDDPNLFQYSYRSDGKTVDATAVGDLDCDGIFITYTLHMDATNGNPSASITEPPPGAD